MLSALVLLVLPILAVHSGDLPDNFPRCCINDPYLDTCLASTLNYLKPYVGDGIPALNIPPLNPAFIPKLIVSDEGQLVNITTTATNVTFYNLNDYDVKELHYDPESLTLSGRIYHQKIPFKTLLETDPPGKALQFEVKGTGDIQGYLIGVDTRFETVGELVLRSGQIHYKPLDTRTYLVMDGKLSKVNGILGPDKELEDKANQWLAVNGKLVGKTFSPVFEKIMRHFIHLCISNFNEIVPMEQIIPTCTFY